MDNKPSIVTAIPKQRYKLGEFIIILLGEIETNDAADYRFITAVMQEGDPEPGIYLTCEKLKGSDNAMRLIMRDGSEIVDNSPEWRDADVFVKDCLDTLQKMLNLTDEEPFKLM